MVWTNELNSVLMLSFSLNCLVIVTNSFSAFFILVSLIATSLAISLIESSCLFFSFSKFLCVLSVLLKLDSKFWIVKSSISWDSYLGRSLYKLVNLSLILLIVSFISDIFIVSAIVVSELSRIFDLSFSFGRRFWLYTLFVPLE